MDSTNGDMNGKAESKIGEAKSSCAFIVSTYLSRFDCLIKKKNCIVDSWYVTLWGNFIIFYNSIYIHHNCN